MNRQEFMEKGYSLLNKIVQDNLSLNNFNEIKKFLGDKIFFNLKIKLLYILYDSYLQNKESGKFSQHFIDKAIPFMFERVIVFSVFFNKKINDINLYAALEKYALQNCSFDKFLKLKYINCNYIWN